MRDIMRKMCFLIAFLGMIAVPRISDAGFSDLAGRVAAWWKAGTIGVHAMDGDAETGAEPNGNGVPQGDGGDVQGDDAPAAEDATSTSTPGMCLVPQDPPVTVCSTDSGFLCVATPSGGASGSEIILTGTIDRASSVLASIEIVAQNDYTKKITSVDTRLPATGSCDAKGLFTGPFCLDAEGVFAAKVDLLEDGPYTISVSASRLSGGSMTQQVRVSRVIAPKLTSSNIVFMPDIATSDSIPSTTTHVTVAVDLLGECQFCDFIGASTGGVTVTVENTIRDAAGIEKRVACSTRTEQGGQGRFMLGVPVGLGQNKLMIRACNAAADGSSCPSVGGFAFSAEGVVDASDAVEFLTPEPRPSYDMDEYPTIPWSFRLAGSNACVSVRFNREQTAEYCPDEGGVYSVELHPRIGINVASLATGSGREEFAWTFGWGKILSPHADGAGMIAVPQALEAGLTDHLLKDVLFPVLNQYLVSDEFEALLERMLAGSASNDMDDGKGRDTETVSIPQCDAGSGGSFSTRLRGRPAIGSVKFKNLALEKGTLFLTADVKDVQIGLDLVPEKDLPPLPLVISFRKALVDLALTSRRAEDGQPLILLTSPHDDCDYKSATYCKHVPAPLIFKNFVGGSTSYGGFVTCDMQLASGKAKEACAAINSLNAQTAVIGEKVLDAINEALYCGGSAALTKAARSGIAIPPVVTGCNADDEACEGVASVIPSVRIPIGVTLDQGLGISPKGLLVSAGLTFGDAETYAHTPAEAAIPSAGIIVGRQTGNAALKTPGGLGGSINGALSLDAVNALLFTAVAQGDGRDTLGILDLDVHESFFRKLGFDFVERCDKEEAAETTTDEKNGPSKFCLMRPRVSELLGTALTTYGYFEGKHPLMLAVRGNRALGARLAVVDAADLPSMSEGDAAGMESPGGSLISIDVGGLTLSFYALEVDEAAGNDAHGNPAIKVDGDGHPIIHSMRPEDPDPWNGPIVRFDLTLILGAEVGELQLDPKDDSQFTLHIGVLGDRTRLVLTPVPGSNATTVPSAGLVSSLAETLKIGMTLLEGFDIPVPREFAFEADDDGVFGMLGLSKIDFGDEGLTLSFDTDLNKVKVAISAALTQILHVEGEEQTFEVH